MQDEDPMARLIGTTEPDVYQRFVACYAEFSSDEELLAWDADGWEEYCKGG